MHRVQLVSDQVRSKFWVNPRWRHPSCVDMWDGWTYPVLTPSGILKVQILVRLSLSVAHSPLSSTPCSEILNQSRLEASTPSQLPLGHSAMYSAIAPARSRQYSFPCTPPPRHVRVLSDAPICSMGQTMLGSSRSSEIQLTVISVPPLISQVSRPWGADAPPQATMGSLGSAHPALSTLALPTH